MKMPCPNCSDGWDEVTNQQCEQCDGAAVVPITQGYVEGTIKHWDAVREACFEALQEYCIATNQHPDYLDTIEEIDEKEVVFIGEHSHCSCCGMDHYRLAMPTRFLWDAEFREQVVDDRLQKLRQEMVEQQRKQSQQQAAKEAEERRLLEILRKKYE